MRKTIGKILLLGSLLVATACGNTEAGNENTRGNSDGVKRISFATASTSGAWYPLGGAWANVISEHVDGLEATAEVGAASIENLRKLHNGDVALAFLQPDVAHSAYHGENEFEAVQMDSIRALVADYGVTVQAVTLENRKINSFEDAAGKRVGVGAPGSGTEITNRMILETAGHTYDDIDEQFLTFPEMTEALKDNQLDIALGEMPVPTGAITDLSLQHNVKLLPVDGDLREKFLTEKPFFFERVIPAGAYKGVDEDIQTIAFRGVTYTTTQLSEQEAYDIVKAIWEHEEEWKGVHSVTEDINLETALQGIPTPLHIGAYKYYQEQGLDIPDHLIPPEAQ